MHQTSFGTLRSPVNRPDRDSMLYGNFRSSFISGRNLPVGTTSSTELSTGLRLFCATPSANARNESLASSIYWIWYCSWYKTSNHLVQCYNCWSVVVHCLEWFCFKKLLGAERLNKAGVAKNGTCCYGRQQHVDSLSLHWLIFDHVISFRSSAILLHSNRWYRNPLFCDIMDSSDHVLASPWSGLPGWSSATSHGRTRGLASVRTYAIVCQISGWCCSSFPSRLAGDGHFTSQNEKEIRWMLCIVYLGKWIPLLWVRSITGN